MLTTRWPALRGAHKSIKEPAKTAGSLLPGIPDNRTMKQKHWWLPLLVGALGSVASHHAVAQVCSSSAGQSATCIVPPGVYALTYEVVGGNGGRSGVWDVGVSTSPGGRGARITGTLSVTPGQILYMSSGNNGADGNDISPEGGGGGGYSAISSISATQGPLVIAAGGGGGGGRGNGFTPGGDAGSPGIGTPSQYGGNAGSGSIGGSGGATGAPGAYGAGGSGGDMGAPGLTGESVSYGAGGGGGGGFGQAGGNGGTAGGVTNSNLPQNFGGGQGGGSMSIRAPAGGGGGGGYAGGGGGGMFAGGGGGSNLVPLDGTLSLGDGVPRVLLYIAPPTIANPSADNVTTTAATLNAGVSAQGADVSAAYFRFGTDQQSVNSDGGVLATATPGTITVAAGATPVNASLTNLTPGATYYFRAYAVNSGGTAQSSTQSFSTPKLTQSIVWGASPLVSIGTSSTINATGGTSGAPVVFGSSTPNTCLVSGNQVTGVAPGTNNCTLTANQAGDASHLPAPQATLTISVVAGVPSAPQNVSATPGDGSVRIVWTPPSSDGGSAITSYEVTANGAPTACTASPCSVSGLANGTAVSFEMRARNAVNAGAPAVVSATPRALANAPVSLPGGSGSVMVTISGNPPGCDLNGPISIDGSVPPGAPVQTAPPLGVLRFAASGCTGSTLKVKAVYPAGSLGSVKPYKFGPPQPGESAKWFPYGTVTGDSVVYEVTDNGTGDNNITTPGAIEDPFTLFALPATGPMGIPTLSQWGIFMMSVLLAMFGLRRMRRQR